MRGKNLSSPSALRRLLASASSVSSPALRRFLRQKPRPGATLAFSGFHMTRDEAGAVDFGSVWAMGLVWPEEERASSLREEFERGELVEENEERERE
ncbi:unnamed protein product [Linum trigynum]|uniref:Uncharacterized protein n=1 Tax=Linum trigynum TaxID=586398 RepID=A0AAV2CXC6_9ROSI